LSEKLSAYQCEGRIFRFAPRKRIRALAKEHGVPIVEDPPLARALFQQAEVGQSIPEGLYRAVAEILAYVYRLQGRKGKPATTLV